MARTFDGTNDQIAFGSEAAIDGLATFTAATLLRITGNVTDERQVLTKMRSDYQGKMYLSLQGSGPSPNVIGVIVSRGSGTDAASLSVANVITTNTWTVLVSTWDGSTAPKIYVCALGGEIAEVSYGSATAGSGTPADDSTATLRIASRDPLDATFFAGGLAESALWNRVLTAREIRSLGRGFAPAFFPRGRVFYCPIDGRHSVEPNWAGTTHGTVTEATYLTHPRVIYPTHVGPRLFKATGSPPATAVPVFVHQLRQQGIC